MFRLRSSLLTLASVPPEECRHIERRCSFAVRIVRRTLGCRGSWCGRRDWQHGQINRSSTRDDDAVAFGEEAILLVGAHARVVAQIDGRLFAGFRRGRPRDAETIEAR